MVVYLKSPNESKKWPLELINSASFEDKRLMYKNQKLPCILKITIKAMENKSHFIFNNIKKDLGINLPKEPYTKYHILKL